MTAKDKLQTGIQRAVRLNEVPPEKFSVMLQRTVLGLLFIVLGVLGLKLWAFPWYAGVGLAVLGATIWSTQVVTGALKALVGPLTQIARATKPEPTPEESRGD